MEQEIRTQLSRMVFTMLGLIGLGIYAYDFVMAGVSAVPALNISIFVVFGLAAAIAFRAIMALKNDVQAMRALKFDYDRRSEKDESIYTKPAEVFLEPQLLGHAYRLITEEIAKQQSKFSIPTGTLHAIVNGIDSRINERKSTVLYFAGLMVFMGLLGTFIGLMQTVGSVGELIGSMDMSGRAGENAFGGLIEGMKAPLKGMAVGFSSSLFGLTTSLVLGMLERFMTAALKAVRNEFEAWLTNMAQLESSGGEEMEAEAQTVLGKAVRRLGSMEGQIRAALDISADTNKAVGKLTVSMHSLVDTVNRHSENSNEELLAQMAEQIAVSQRDTMHKMAGLIQTQMDDRMQMQHAIDALVRAADRMSMGDLHPERIGPSMGSRVSAETFDHHERIDAESEFAFPDVGGKIGVFTRIHRALRSRGLVSVASHERRYAQLVHKLGHATEMAHRSLHRAMTQLEASRTADRNALFRFRKQQDLLASNMAVLAAKVEQLASAVVGSAEDKARALSRDLHTARMEFEVAMKRLEQHALHAQESSEEAKDMARDAVEQFEKSKQQQRAAG